MAKTLAGVSSDALLCSLWTKYSSSDWYKKQLCCNIYNIYLVTKYHIFCALLYTQWLYMQLNKNVPKKKKRIGAISLQMRFAELHTYQDTIQFHWGQCSPWCTAGDRAGVLPPWSTQTGEAGWNLHPHTASAGSTSSSPFHL